MFKLVGGTGDQVKVLGLRTRVSFKDYECSHQVATLFKKVDTLDKRSAGAFGGVVGLVGNIGEAIKSLTGTVTTSRKAIKSLTGTVTT